MKSEQIIKRLKCAKYFSENIHLLTNQLNDLFQPSFIHFLSSDKFKNHFSLFLSTNEDYSTTTMDEKKEFLEYIEQLSCLDQFNFPDDYCQIDQDHSQE